LIDDTVIRLSALPSLPGSKYVDRFIDDYNTRRQATGMAEMIEVELDESVARPPLRAFRRWVFMFWAVAGFGAVVVAAAGSATIGAYLHLAVTVVAVITALRGEAWGGGVRAAVR
jgi:hypothetical protein